MIILSAVEGHLLASIWRYQPTTAYFVRKSLGRSLATNISSSPGGIYPALKRLKARGLVSAQAADGDSRGTEVLTLTDDGARVVKSWLVHVPDEDLLPEDPLRTRIGFADVLDPLERLNWLADARRKLRMKLHELTEAMRLEHPLLTALAYENARAQTQARLSWIDLAIAELTTTELNQS